jgi:hypothetical protein
MVYRARVAFAAITHNTRSRENRQPRMASIEKREKGFEPSTPTLATWCSTPELLPHVETRSGDAAESYQMEFGISSLVKISIG